MRAWWLTLVILFCFPLEASEATLKSLLVNLSEQLKEKRAQDLELWLKTYYQSSEVEQKAHAALIVSKYYLETAQPGLALQFLRSIEGFYQPAGERKNILQFFLAQAYFDLKNQQASRNQALELLAHGVKDPMRKKVYHILLNSLYGMGQYDKFLTYFKRYQARYPYHKRDAGIRLLVANIWRAKGKLEQEVQMLERLLSEYPFSEASRQSFIRLQQYQRNHRYAFSLAALKQLSYNSTFDETIKDFVVDQIKNHPIRLRTRGSAQQLSDSKRIDILLQLNFIAEARFWLDRLAQKKALQSCDMKSLLARTYYNEENFEQASKLYQNVAQDRKCQKYGGLIREARIALAQSYEKLEQYEQAAAIYQQLGRQTHSTRFRFREFWNLYKAKSYEQALKLINDQSYSLVKDKQFPGFLIYWRARILEHLKRDAEANQLYLTLLNKDLTGYYAGLILSSKPELREFFEQSVDADKSQELSSSQQNFDRKNIQFVELSDKPADHDDVLMNPDYPLAFREIVEPVAETFTVNKYFILSLMRAESSFNPRARSWVGARGLMQIMPKTGYKIARSNNLNLHNLSLLEQPEINISFSAYYINELLNYYEQNPVLAIAAYNAGPKAVNSWLKTCRQCSVDEFVEGIPYRETRRYVKKVLSNFRNYLNIYEKDLKIWQLPRSLPSVDFNVELY